MTVKEWLEANACIDVKPVKVTIGKESYEGCFYRENRNPQQQRIYLVGKLPKLKHPKDRKYPVNNVCFTYNGKEWYVAHYVTERGITEEFAKYHPFGPAFGVIDWPHGKIDEYERKPYKRYPMTVEVLSDSG